MMGECRVIGNGGGKRRMEDRLPDDQYARAINRYRGGCGTLLLVKGRREDRRLLHAEVKSDGAQKTKE